MQIAFVLDCRDREAITFVARAHDLQARDIQQLMQQAVCYRFEGQRPIDSVQWLSDNGGIYTALETLIAAEKLGLVPITTPAYSPQSNGMSEAFVNTLKRDYVEGAMLWDAQSVLAQVPGWFEDYNHKAPDSALGMLSPRQYREKCRQMQEQFDSLIKA